MNKSFGFIKPFVLIGLPIFIIHYSLFQIPFLSEEQTKFYYTIPFLYLLYFIFSLVSLTIIYKISQKNFINTGMTFMIVMTVKFFISFLILKPILDKTNENNQIEKLNFLFILILFLAIEAFITTRILNKKQ